MNRIDRARQVADAVLYEGYRLHPYRPPVTDDRVRWQVGVVGPVGAKAQRCGEDSRMSADCLLDIGPESTTDVQLRFLQHQSRAVWRLVATPGRQPSFTPVSALTCDSQTWRSWDEAVEHAVDLPGLRVRDLLRTSVEMPVEIPGGGESEPLHDEDGALIGKLVRERWPLTGVLRVSARRSGSAVVLQLRLENRGEWTPGSGENRGGNERALWSSFLSTHMVAAVHDGQFLSLREPPEWAAAIAARCESHRCWPVLIGARGDCEVVLASPVVLHDWPEVGALVDSISIDELLALRAMTPATDGAGSAAAVGSFAVDFDGAPNGTPIPQRRDPVDDMSTKDVSSAVDAREPEPYQDDEEPIAIGTEVRLCPSFRAEAQNLVAAGQIAVVTDVSHEGDRTWVAVVLRDDPLGESSGWCLHFELDEVQPINR